MRYYNSDNQPTWTARNHMFGIDKFVGIELYIHRNAALNTSKFKKLWENIKKHWERFYRNRNFRRSISEHDIEK